MLFIDFFSIFSLIIFAHITESKIYILRDFNDEPNYIDSNEQGPQNAQQFSKHDEISGSVYKPKRTRNFRPATIHHGRNIYQLDNYEDLTKLRTKINAGHISYDYFDLNDLVRADARFKSIPWNYVEDLLVLNPKTPILFPKCKDSNCDNNPRKFNELFSKLEHRKRTPHSVDVGKKNLRLDATTRFKIVDNARARKQQKARMPKNKLISSEEHDGNIKTKTKRNKKKRYTPQSASTEETKEWKDSSTENNEKKKRKRQVKKEKHHDSNSQSSEEIYTTKKPKSVNEFESHSDSWENLWQKDSSIEDSWQKKKQKKKKYPAAETKRKTMKKFGKPDSAEMYIQGNNLISSTAGDNDDIDDDRRRRLPQFLPKRYHWDPADIHDLGYFWFNGPKGRYPAEQSLLSR